jgi:xylulokinase
LLDANEKPLRPAILWNDGRSHAQCTTLEKTAPNSRTITGNMAMSGFTAPKLLWVKEHEADIFTATKTVLLPKDYVRLLMTGDKATDLSDASGTLWINVAKRDWSDTMLSASGLNRSHMPTLFEGTEITGTLLPNIARAWGMQQVPVVAGAGDNAAGAIGVGVTSPGQAFLSLGTSGVIFAATNHFMPSPERGVHAFCHCLPHLWHQMSVSLSAASAIDWAARLAGVNGAANLITTAEAANTFDGKAIFLPYLSDERTPHNDTKARGVLFGLDHDFTAAQLGQAALEGVAFSLSDGLQALENTGTEIESLTVIGGGARSSYWGRILAAALNKPLVYRNDAEVGPAFGAARLARIGLTGQKPNEVCTPPPIKAIIEPNINDHERLALKHDKFKALYTNLRNHFREQSNEPS